MSAAVTGLFKGRDSEISCFLGEEGPGCSNSRCGTVTHSPIIMLGALPQGIL